MLRSAFTRCRSLVSITIPESAMTIGEGASGGCSSLRSITIPESVTAIGDSAFEGKLCRSKNVKNILKMLLVAHRSSRDKTVAMEQDWRCKSLSDVGDIL